jgi:hypothetical protein
MAGGKKHLSTAAIRASNISREILQGRAQHEKDFCRCGYCGVVHPVGRACSRARRRCSIRRGVRGDRLGACRCSCRRRGWLYGGAVCCSLVGTEAIRTSYKAVHDNNLPQSRVSARSLCSWCGSEARIRYPTTCHGSSRQGGFNTTSQTLCGNDRHMERTTRPRIGMTSLNLAQDKPIEIR